MGYHKRASVAALGPSVAALDHTTGRKREIEGVNRGPTKLGLIGKGYSGSTRARGKPKIHMTRL